MRYVIGHNNRVPDPKVDALSGCWVWAGACDEKGRAGEKVANGRSDRAYRTFYEQHVGPIPKGHHLHHTCENPMCVNPAHLEPLTPAEHAKRHKTAA